MATNCYVSLVQPYKRRQAFTFDQIALNQFNSSPNVPSYFTSLFLHAEGFNLVTRLMWAILKTESQLMNQTAAVDYMSCT